MDGLATTDDYDDDQDMECADLDSDDNDPEETENERKTKAMHAITGRGVTLSMLMQDGFIQPGSNCMSIEYLVRRLFE